MNILKKNEIKLKMLKKILIFFIVCAIIILDDLHIYPKTCCLPEMHGRNFKDMVIKNNVSKQAWGFVSLAFRIIYEILYYISLHACAPSQKG